MKDNNERNSAPTGANETVNEMKLEANDPLGGAACSASCFAEALFLLTAKHLVKNKEWLNPNIKYWAGVVEQAARGFDVQKHYSSVRKAVEEL